MSEYTVMTWPGLLGFSLVFVSNTINMMDCVRDFRTQISYIFRLFVLLSNKPGFSREGNDLSDNKWYAMPKLLFLHETL